MESYSEYGRKPTPDSKFWVGMGYALLPSIALWALIIWGVTELVDLLKGNE